MNQIEIIAQKLKDADAVLVGASNGFSISEGLHIFASNQAFEDLFGDFKRKYGIRNILEGMFARFPSEEAKWTYFSRLANHYSGSYTGSKNTDALKKIIGDKPYFMVTSNGENHFELAGFDPECIYEIEGSWKEMQCAKPCHDKLYPAFPAMKKMAEAEENGLVPSDLVPKCPKCGGPMQLHIVGDGFIQDNKIRDRFQKFIDTYHGKNLVILELGIGWRNQLIKGPFMRLAAGEPNVTYVAINKGEIYLPDEIKGKSFGLDGDMTQMLSKLAEQV